MDEFDKEQNEEMLNQVKRYENYKLTGEKTWFDSDNYVDIIDWYYLNDMNDKAEEVVMEAYSLFKDNEEIVSRYANLFAYKGEYDKAIEIIKQALKTIPSDDLYTDLASLYIDSGQNADEALDILFRLIKNDSGYYFYYMLIGRIYLDKDDLVNAEQYFRKAIELNNGDRMLLGCYTDCSYEDSLQTTMIRFLYNLTQDNPFNDLAWTALGIVYSRYYYIDEAIEAFDYAIAINPKGEIRHSCKADCLIEKKDYANAKKEILIAIDNSKDDTPELHIVLASILMHEGNHAEALMHFLNVHKKKAELADKTYLLDMALCYYYTGQDEKALMFTEEAAREGIPYELIIDFARRLNDNGFVMQSEDLFETIITNNTDKNTVELAAVTFAALKSRDGNTFEAVKIMENTLAELHSCTEDFWYAFLRITCQDRAFDNYTIDTLRLLMNLKSFPTYIKEHYPEIIENPNYKRCLKKIFYV